MADFSVIIFENGFPPTIPGFLQNTPVSTFPFWGHFTFLDFFMTNFIGNKKSNIYLVLHRKYKRILPFITQRWKDEIAQNFILENETTDFLSFISQIKSHYIIICSPACIAFFNPVELIEAIEDHPVEISKINIDNHPVDFYVLRKYLLVDYIKKLIDKESTFTHVITMIFEDLLEKHFDHTINIKGTVFFNNTLMQLYQGNLWLIRNIQSDLFLNLLPLISGKITAGKDSIIHESGQIRNSYLSSGVEIEGYVENSIIFPKVIVKKKSVVINSVLMNNNIIGRNVHIQNTLILPYDAENTNILYNIGDNAVIGGKFITVKNRDYPDQIYNGLTVLGANTHVPKGFKSEQSTYIGPYINLKKLKEIKLLKKGISLYIKQMETNE